MKSRRSEDQFEEENAIYRREKIKTEEHIQFTL